MSVNSERELANMLVRYIDDFVEMNRDNMRDSIADNTPIDAEEMAEMIRLHNIANELRENIVDCRTIKINQAQKNLLNHILQQRLEMET